MGELATGSCGKDPQRRLLVIGADYVVNEG